MRDTNSPLNHSDSDYKYGRFDVSALHIAHALKQTEVQKAYNKAREKPIDHYLVSTFVNFQQNQSQFTLNFFDVLNLHKWKCFA